ncbi:MAG: dicarboxylate/amino acid:cation symporter [Verrucomicrobia bacterium]|nr:MAG: dicarboxylate/amino acid:cation symporter [Verrucomicrobiota bacterium]
MKFKLQLHWQILISIILAMLASWLVKSYGGSEGVIGVKFIAGCDFIGTMFLNALKMIVVPLIACSIVSGMIGMGAEKHFGRMGVKTLAFYFITTLTAVLIGLICVNVIRPGEVSTEAAQAMLAQAKTPTGFEEKLAEHSTGDIINVFIRMIPVNIFSAASNNTELLGVIFFFLLFGYFMTRLPLKLRRFQVKFWHSFQQVTLAMADLILTFAPIGVFALVTPKFIDFGLQLFIPVAKFSFTVLLGLGLHFFGVMSLLLMLVRINPLDHFRAMAPAIMTAFSTASSVTTIPITMEALEKTAGVSNRVTSFTVPLGSTMNMNGTALYECVVVIFVAQFYKAAVNPDFVFGLGTQISVVILSLFTSFGIAGIPAASIVSIALILGVVGLPFEYVGLVLVVDRVLDMCRTVVNMFSDSVAAVVIGKSEGETQIYAKNRVIDDKMQMPD